MDPATLAASVTTLLAPFLAKAGTTIAQEVINKLPEAVGGLWKAVAQRFQGKPAAEAAANDLAAKPDDEDNQEAFALQLRKMLKDDPAFLEEIAGLHDKAQASINISNTGSGAVATGGSVAAGAGGVAIGGSVAGNIVIGNQNTVSSSSSGSSNSGGNSKPLEP